MRTIAPGLEQELGIRHLGGQMRELGAHRLGLGLEPAAQRGAVVAGLTLVEVERDQLEGHRGPGAQLVQEHEQAVAVDGGQDSRPVGSSPGLSVGRDTNGNVIAVRDPGVGIAPEVIALFRQVLSQLLTECRALPERGTVGQLVGAFQKLVQQRLRHPDTGAVSEPDEGDVEAMFEDFVPLQLQCLAQYADLIPGTLEAIAESALQRKIGARGLRMIIEELMLELMYTIPSQNSISECVITREVVVSGEKPIMVIEKAG